MVKTQQMWRRQDPAETQVSCKVDYRDAAQGKAHPSMANRQHRHILTCAGLAWGSAASLRRHYHRIEGGKEGMAFTGNLAGTQ